MHLFLADPDPTPFLADELRRAAPEAAQQEIPGLGIAAEVSLEGLLLAFARQTLPNAFEAQAVSINAWADRIIEAVAGVFPDDQPWRLHLWPQYGEGRAGLNRCELIRAAVAERLKKKRRHLLRWWVQEGVASGTEGTRSASNSQSHGLDVPSPNLSPQEASRAGSVRGGERDRSPARVDFSRHEARHPSSRREQGRGPGTYIAGSHDTRDFSSRPAQARGQGTSGAESHDTRGPSPRPHPAQGGNIGFGKRPGEGSPKAPAVETSAPPFTPTTSLVQCVLTSPDNGWISAAVAPLPHAHRGLISAFPRGEVPLADDKSAPSRAFTKLVESEQRLGRFIGRGQTCVDLGASPGSWSYVAIQRGAHVIAVDRSELREDLMRNPRLRFETADAFKYRPPETVDWLVCDVIAAPQRSIDLLLEWLRERRMRNFVVTIKFKGQDEYALLDLLKREAPPLCGEFHLTRLCANKNEVCAFGSV